MDKAAATATTVPLFCQTYLGITIKSASRFLRLFNVFWNLSHVLDVNWPSEYWGDTIWRSFGGILNVPYW